METEQKTKNGKTGKGNSQVDWFFNYSVGQPCDEEQSIRSKLVNSPHISGKPREQKATELFTLPPSLVLFVFSIYRITRQSGCRKFDDFRILSVLSKDDVGLVASFRIDLQLTLEFGADCEVT